MAIAPIEPVVIGDFTGESLDGTGVFDVMMRTVQKHVAQEHAKGRIKGPEYATVYLGALQGTMDRALDFVLTKDKVALEAEILRLQAEKLEIEKLKIAAEVLLVEAQIEKMEIEKTLVAAQVILAQAQTTKVLAEIDLLALQQNKIAAEVRLIDAEVIKAGSENLRIIAQTTLIDRQAANELLQGQVLIATECKLRAEFDVLQQQVLKTEAETGLLNQKKVTEQAQTNGAGVDETSVIGKQIVLYGAQADGFKRDGEQKAAKIMVDSWNVRRTTDEATAGAPAGLGDGEVQRAVSSLLTGVGA
jgi:hypothetical protein